MEKYERFIYFLILCGKGHVNLKMTKLIEKLYMEFEYYSLGQQINLSGEIILQVRGVTRRHAHRSNRVTTNIFLVE